jgi:hypothetical protein
MKILVITSPQEDYLSDSLILGFRELFGTDCVDWPKAEVLYRNHGLQARHNLYGRGFTLYSGLLEDLSIERFRIESSVREGGYDLIVFTSIQRQFGIFIQLRPWLNRYNTIVIDGEDTSAPYPAHGFYWRRPHYWCLPRAHNEFLYFKREWTGDTHFNIATRIVPRWIRNLLPHAPNLRKIAFSFPEEKIIRTLPIKKRDFPRHIVDPEIAQQVPNASTSYAFSDEVEYYKDLREARFGITTKRAGWDCLRHYEIAANGAVPCFRALDKKPPNCAPHGLSNANSICYNSAQDLFEKIRSLTKKDYARLQQGALDWVNLHTTRNQAKMVLAEFMRIKGHHAMYSHALRH